MNRTSQVIGAVVSGEYANSEILIATGILGLNSNAPVVELGISITSGQLRLTSQSPVSFVVRYVNIPSANLALSGQSYSLRVIKRATEYLSFDSAETAILVQGEEEHVPCGHWNDDATEEEVFPFAEQDDKIWNWFDGSADKFRKPS